MFIKPPQKLYSTKITSKDSLNNDNEEDTYEVLSHKISLLYVSL